MRRVSLADVAKAAGVAKATASRALSSRQQDVGEATRARILEVAADLGYQPNRAAQSLRTGRLRLLAAAVPGDASGWEPILAGAAAQARRRGYHLVLHYLDPARDGDQPVDGLSVDGLLLISPGRTLPPVIGEDGVPLPTAVVDDNLEHGDGALLRTALWQAGRAAGRHLADQGRTRLAVLAESSGPVVDGFLAACSAARLPVPEVHIAAPAEAAVEPVVTEVLVDGFFATSPALAAHSVVGFRRGGLTVPEDVSLVAFGDGELARHFDPPLTVVRPPWAALGARAVDLLVDAVEDAAAVPAGLELVAELVVRGSSVPERRRSFVPD
ncbi:LacI family DNA-binding transcriptional regulator [Amycolatopsis jiangsuensis]|uniref:LacI family transcriptional regulator n=1 Tax=Amycolatopsis jiangsuensis TaxID=1181879 RepID=A0A840IZ82_9PSEU|nr:LacI family DNA-binding transcriptional regulator [Amycolatopsis jiangsuensis]MBB4686725.1 LacI family transcriptional regulator [Amycolatopsis jiangsuensis]